MFILGLVDEAGAVNTYRREDYNIYMNKVWLKKHPEALKQNAEYPSTEDIKKYFEDQEKNGRYTKRKSYLFGIFKGKNR